MRKIHKIYFVLLIPALFFIASCEKDKVDVAQYGSITGLVKDGSNDQVVANANVTTNPPSSAVLTDAEGRFTITDVVAGDVSISVKKEKYSSSTLSVMVKANQTTDVTILINPSEGQTGADVKIGNPSPANQATGLPLSVDLRWQLLDNAGFDTIKYDVMLYKSEDLIGSKVGTNLTDTMLLVEDLEFQKTYFWQVVAKNEGEELNRTTVWSFSTVDLPELPYFYVKKKEGSFEIFNSDSIINDTTAPRVQLTSDPAYINWLPQVNSARNNVAFTSNKQISPYIYRMKLDGSEEMKVSTYPVIGYHNLGEGFSWSPNGDYVIYGYYEKLVREAIYINQVTVLATAPEGMNFRQCHWERLSNKIVVQAMGEQIYNSEFYLMNADGSDMELLVPDYPGRLESPSLSADAQYLLYTYDASGINDPTGKQYDANIYLMEISTGDSINVSYNKPGGSNDILPRFAPDDYHIIFVSQDNNALNSIGDVYICNGDGTVRRRVVENATMPFWM